MIDKNYYLDTNFSIRLMKNSFLEKKIIVIVIQSI